MNPFANAPLPPSIPSYLSESIFRQYEPHIKRAIETYPDEAEFTKDLFLSREGKPLSGNTFVARFRDSIASVLRFQWETNINMEKLWSLSGKYSVSQDAVTGSVWFRNKIRHGRPTQYVKESRVVGAAGGFGGHVAPVATKAWENVTSLETAALCLLVSNKRLDGPFVMEGLVNAELVAELEGKFNVAFTLDEVKNQTIIL